MKKLFAALAVAALVALVWIALPSLDQAQTTGRGTGIIEWIDMERGTVTLRHSAVPALNMEPMTMSFRVLDKSQLSGLQPMEPVAFQLSYDRRTGYTITDIQSNPGRTTLSR